VAVFSVPELEEEPWPTLGPQVCAFIETYLVFGPGDLEKLPARLDDEKRALIYRAYEIYPPGAKDANGKPIAGRRRFRRVALSLQKGSGKTELAAWIAACELSPEAPVRCDGFDAYGRPVGRPIPSPYIPMVAYTEEQASDLAYGVLKAILEESPIASQFDIGIDRILRASGSGKAVALAGAPSARDGALTTFQHFDETHRMNTDRHRRAHQTMLANLTKRLLADPWELETTTAFTPGENSVAEETRAYAQAVAEGKRSDSRLFYFHRQAADTYDWTDPEQRRQALVEAAGPTAPWKDIEGISALWEDPKADFDYLERVYGNRPTASASQAFNVGRWRELRRPDYVVPDGVQIVAGFDGAIWHDGTALVCQEISSGHQWLAGLWEPPATASEGWSVPVDEVEAVLAEVFRRWKVWRLYADPAYWETYVAEWAGKYGEKVVAQYRTNRYFQMASDVRAFANDIAGGEISHDGDERLERHIGNARKLMLNFRDDQGERLWVIHKERSDSPNKIDAAMAAVLANTARRHALAAGALNTVESVYNRRPLIVFGE
jgi:phage terminase large subunit-like protein